MVYSPKYKSRKSFNWHILLPNKKELFKNRFFATVFMSTAIYTLLYRLLQEESNETSLSQLLVKRLPLFNERARSQVSNYASKLQLWTVSKKDTIIIAAVVCSIPGDDGPRDEAAVMIKSVIISWMLFKYEARLEIHLFLEHKEDEWYFLSKLKEFGLPLPKLDLSLIFHSAMNTVPKQYHDEMMFDKKFRCMYIRCFFPDLFKEEDSVMYLDTDVIITGNPVTVWNHFKNMNDEQLVGVVEVLNEKSPLNPVFFEVMPVHPPRGWITGLLLMNLTRMREYHFVEKLLQIYKDYTKFFKGMNDQKLINILLYYDQSIMYELPCQFSYWFERCRRDSYCKHAVNDTDGIHVVQGCLSRFEKGKEFYDLFELYKKVNLTSSTLNLHHDLIQPIKSAYSRNRTSDGSKKKSRKNQCSGVLDKLLFKNVS